MTYSDEEIRASVEKLMVTKTRFPMMLRAGVRRLDVTFNDIQEAAASVFITNHDALFALSDMSAKRLRYDVAAYLDVVSVIYDLVGKLERAPVPIENVTPLVDATSALLQLETVSGTSKSQEVSTSPAYLRFREKIDLFLASVKGNVVKGGSVVESIQQSQSTIASSVSTLSDAHANVVERLQYIEALQTTYAALSLPSVMLHSTVSNARKLVELKAYRIRNQTEEQNQLEIRQTVLDLLASKAVMKRAALFTSPAESRSLTGSISPFADVDRPATSGVVETVDGPFDVRDTSGGGTTVLTFEFDDSSAAYDVELPASSESLVLRGSAAGPYTFFSADLPASSLSNVIGSPTLSGNAALVVYLMAYDDPDIHEAVFTTLVTSGAKTATSIAAEIDAAIVVASLDAYFEAAVVSGRVEIRSLTGGTSRLVSVLSMPEELRDIMGAHLIAENYGKDKNNILNMRVGSATSPFDQWFTLPDGTWTASQVAGFINVAKPALMPMDVEAVPYGYTSPPYPPYDVLQLTCTDSSYDAVLQALPTYDPGGGDEPSIAYVALTLAQSMERENAAISALDLMGQLRLYEDSGTGNTEIWDRSILTSDGTKVIITSKSTLLASRVKVSGDGCSQFFGAASVEAKSETEWLELSDSQEQLSGGDVLTANTGVETSHVIDEVEQPYVHVTPAIPGDQAAITFDSHTVPWAEVTYGKKQDFDSLAALISTWLETWEDASSYLTELTRLLNMVLADKNPTSAEINDVQAHLDLLVAGLDSIYATLDAHSVDRSKELEDMIRTYREKGCERAVDLLLECRLEDFFNLTMETASYAGNMLDAVRSVVRGDMPVSKYDRQYSDNRTLATVPSPDYEYDFSDSEDDDMLGDDEAAIDEL